MKRTRHWNEDGPTDTAIKVARTDDGKTSAPQKTPQQKGGVWCPQCKQHHKPGSACKGARIRVDRPPKKPKKIAKAEQIPGGRAAGRKPSDFDADALAEGTRHEMEHTTDQGERIAREIAMDHLAENPQYYVELREIEKGGPLRFKKKPAKKIQRRMKFAGMSISIETDKGQQRHWHDPHSGESGSTTMQHPYGYILRTIGEDDEQVDVYVGPHEDAPRAYVIHQMKKPGFEKYDEDKVMLGFASAQEAKAAYLAHYNSPKFFGSMSTIPVEHFRRVFVTPAGQPMKKAAPTDHVAALLHKAGIPTDSIGYAERDDGSIRGAFKAVDGRWGSFRLPKDAPPVVLWAETDAQRLDAARTMGKLRKADDDPEEAKPAEVATDRDQAEQSRAPTHDSKASAKKWHPDAEPEGDEAVEDGPDLRRAIEELRASNQALEAKLLRSGVLHNAQQYDFLRAEGYSDEEIELTRFGPALNQRFQSWLRKNLREELRRLDDMGAELRKGWR